MIHIRWAATAGLLLLGVGQAPVFSLAYSMVVARDPLAAGPAIAAVPMRGRMTGQRPREARR